MRRLPAPPPARYPALVTGRAALLRNLAVLERVVHGAGCSLMIVTKCFCADGRIARVLAQSPAVDYLADSRIQNLARCAGLGKTTVLLRLPQASEIAEVVRYADISFNSEAETLRLLNAEAGLRGVIHRVVLMVDLGDLREGVFFTDEEELFELAQIARALPHLRLAGLATNLTCYGAVLPTPANLSRLAALAARMKERFGLDDFLVSGGNSSSYYLAERGALPAGVNNLRLGEAFLLGNDTAHLAPVAGCGHDAFTLEAQIIELKTKPSLPVGERGADSFGQKPDYEDRGLRRRAIVALGRQDTDHRGLVPLEAGARVLGASSDHLIVDVTDCARAFRVGDVLSFRPNYSALLRAFTSRYVRKDFGEGRA